MRNAALLSLALALGGALAGCEPQPKPGELIDLETEDVAESVDALLDTSFDRRGPRIVEGVAGFLPSDFPARFPIVTPASLIDQGGSGAGSRFVVIQIAGRVESVRPAQLDRLRGAGWSVSGGGDAWTAEREGRRASLAFESDGPITDLRVRY